MALVGCAPPTGEYAGYTTPFGIVYNENPPSEATIKHEQQHWKDYQEDPLFFFKYSFVEGYACEAEKKANLAGGIYPLDDHPACR